MTEVSAFLDVSFVESENVFKIIGVKTKLFFCLACYVFWKKRCHWTARQVERIHKLELMDEFEEWHLIQGHYFVLCASRPETDLWVHNCTIFNKTPAEENWEGAGKRRCQWASRDWWKTNLNRELEEMGSWAMSWWSAVSRCNIPVYGTHNEVYYTHI